jgi:NADPH:quinone reductase-like Zn-dependent oxidoreductase
MKAVRMHAFGPADVLRHEDAPAPVPRPDEILVRVRAVGVNHFDVWMREGARRRVELPHVLGSDVAGEVVHAAGAVGPGDRVVLYPATSCGACPACHAGEESLCESYRAIDGGYAELVAAPAANAHPMPTTLSFEEAAALPIAYLTAWRMVVTKARVTARMPVLVMGASGGVGTACVQIAVALGARVLAGVSRVDDRAAYVAGLGAEAVFDYGTETALTAVRRWLGEAGVPVVLDHVGARVWEPCLAALARGGRLVSCGFTTGSEVRLELAVLTGRELALDGVVMGSRREFAAVLRAVAAGHVKPVVGEVLPLARAREAHVALEQGQARGKIVLTP